VTVPPYSPPPASPPPPQFPGPQFPGPPAPPPKRSHTLRNVLIIVGVVVVLCCGGAVTAGVVLVNKGLGALKPAQDATNAFVTALESGDYPGAYGRLCASTQADFTLDQFSQCVRSQPQIRSHRIVGAYINSVNGHTNATVTEELTQDSGFVQTHTFLLVKEGGAWKVCGRPY
jgi:Domain of unknown function (DUF4878)